MSIYLVTGKLGSGKTLGCVARIKDALMQGRRVVTNLDLHLEHLLPRNAPRPDCIRIPDKPVLADFEAVGIGNPVKDERRNGLIVLDELGAWLNTREFQDKDRAPVIKWLLHSRKLGWDVYFIIQHQSMIDKQVRDGLAEHLVTCRRTDRLRVPFIGPILKIGLLGRAQLPQIHVATVRLGMDQHAFVVDRWWYRARDLYEGYDTRQVFTDDRTGLYSMLGPQYVQKPKKITRGLLAKLFGRPSPDAQRLPSAAEKAPRVAALMRLPPDARMRLYQRLEAGVAGGARAALAMHEAIAVARRDPVPAKPG